MLENTLSFNRRADFALDSIPAEERSKFKTQIKKLTSWNPRKKRANIKPFSDKKNMYIYQLGSYIVVFEYHKDKNEIEVDDLISESLINKFK